MNTETQTQDTQAESTSEMARSLASERYAKLIGVGIAEEIIEASPDNGFDDQCVEGRDWLAEFYGDLHRALGSNNEVRIVDFLRTYYEDRVCDFDRQDLLVCAEAFAERIMTASV